MFSNLDSSPNFIWSTSSFLGKGSTGSVYKGFYKKSGEAVAIKTFLRNFGWRSVVQNREFEVLGKVNHENIVKLLAVEEETKNHSRIIVMELCTGGSLYTILSDPENTYGFAETEFLLVLKHTSSGMKYLRDVNIVHRDLKPGNIMKYVTSDGKHVYKLTDFGAARELKEGQLFDSLHGTLEYLHPDLYERAVLNKYSRKSFGASVDLWSMGVTLYHVATGALPFRPFEGRNNREIMHMITTQKKSGIISGVQNSARGRIEWSDQLPLTCQLSVGLRKLVTPILAGLMECDESKMWTFDRFFSEVTHLLKKIRHILFFVDQCQLLTLYVDPNDKMVTFHNLIKEQTNILPEKQRLYFKKKIFEDVVGAETLVSSYPQTSLEHPLFLVGNESPTIIYTEEPCAHIYFPRMASSVTVNNDTFVAKSICSNGYYVKRYIEKTALIFYLLQDFVQIINVIVKNQFIKLKSAIDQADLKSKSIDEKLNFLQTHHKTTSAFFDLLENSNSSIISDYNTQLSKLVEIKQQSCATVIKQLHIVQDQLMPDYKKIVNEDFLWNQWKELPSFKKDLKKRLACANSYIRILRSCWRKLDKLCDQRDTSYLLSDQLYLLEKIRIDEIRRNLLSVYQDECLSALKNAVEDIGQWLNLVHRTSANRTDQNLPKMVDELNITLNKANETYFEIVSDNITRYLSKRDCSSWIIPSKKCLVLAKSNKRAKAVAGTNDETVELLEMNKVLISKLKAASVSLNYTIEKFKV